MRVQLERNEGMTLIEIIVAIMILGIFMAIAVPAVTKSFRAIDQAKRLTARYPKAHKALDQISNMLRQTYPTAFSPDAAFVGRNSSFEAGGIKLPSDELSFPVLDTKYAHVRSAQVVSYQLELNPSEEGVPRGIVQTRSFSGTESRTAIKETILERVVGLDFSYLDDSIDPAQWVNEWPPSPSEEGPPSQSNERSEAVGDVVSDTPGAAAPENTIRTPAAVKITIFMPGEISLKPKSFTMVINVPAR